MKLSEQKLRNVIREEIQRQINEYDNPVMEAADISAQTRGKLVREINPMLNNLINKIKEFDSDKAGWAESIREDLRDVEDELYDLGNELSMRR